MRYATSTDRALRSDRGANDEGHGARRRPGRRQATAAQRGLLLALGAGETVAYGHLTVGQASALIGRMQTEDTSAR